MLEHFHIHWIWDDYKLVLNKYDSTAITRYIFLDLSHQTKTRSNYLNDLLEKANYFNCHQILIFANEVSQSLRNNLPKDILTYFINASLEPSINQEDHQFYSILCEEGDSDEMGYVPQVDMVISRYEFETYLYLN